MAMAAPIARSTIEEMAYHEAGHAVAAVRYGVRLKDISIIPDTATQGRLQFEESLRIDFDNTPRETAQTERFMVILLAGMTAQSKYSSAPRSFRNSVSDLQLAAGIMSRLNRSSDRGTEFFTEMQKRASEFVGKNWMIIDRLAKLLIERRELTGVEATAEILVTSAVAAAGFGNERRANTP